jgi:hypothetical protein
MLRREERRPDGRDKRGILLATGLLFVPFLSGLILETCSFNTDGPFPLIPGVATAGNDGP